MKTCFLQIAIIAIFSLQSTYCFSQSPSWFSAISYGGSNNAYVSAITDDKFGNHYIVGSFTGNHLFLGNLNLLNWSGGETSFVAKQDSNGDFIWARAIDGGDSYGNKATSVAVDSVGNLYIAGWYRNLGIFVDFNNPVDTLFNTTWTTQNNNGSSDFYIAKYSSTGSVLWAKTAKGNRDESITSLTVDNDGSPIVACAYNSDTLFVDSDTIVNTGNVCLLVIKYNSNGDVVWNNNIVGNIADYNQISSIKTDSSKNIYIAGWFESPSLTFQNVTINNTSTRGSFIAKYSTNGNILWANNLPGVGYNEANSLVLDNSGNPLITGRFLQSLTLGSTFLSTQGGLDIYLAKYSNNGDVIWAKSFGYTGMENANSITFDENNKITMAGSFQQKIYFDGDSLLSSSGLKNIFVAKFDDNGNYIGAINTNSNYFLIDYDVLALNNNAKLLVGNFLDNQLTFGQDVLNSFDSVHFFIARIEDKLIVNAGNDIQISCGDTIHLNAANNYNGSGSLTYSWFPSAGLSDTTIQNPTSVIHQNITYYVTVSSTDGYVASDSVDVVFIPNSVKEICFVEFDTLSLKNSVVWGGLDVSKIDSVKIYRETSTNVWTKMGTVPASQTHFIDSTSNPYNQSYSYKIRLKDKCELETEYSSYHTTITLLAVYDSGTNTYGFTWSAYYGLPISNYYLYGLTEDGTKYLIASMPGNQYFYNYTNPFFGFKRFFIAFETQPCSEKTNYLVKSNFVSLTSVENNPFYSNIQIYPNPVNSELKINSDFIIEKAEVIDFTGKIYKTSNSNIINCSNLSQGAYGLRIFTKYGIVYKSFIKE